MRVDLRSVLESRQDEKAPQTRRPSTRSESPPSRHGQHQVDGPFQEHRRSQLTLKSQLGGRRSRRRVNPCYRILSPTRALLHIANTERCGTRYGAPYNESACRWRDRALRRAAAFRASNQMSSSSIPTRIWFPIRRTRAIVPLRLWAPTMTRARCPGRRSWIAGTKQPTP